jgi:hypothetical protein
VEVVPSPKFHSHASGVPIERSVKATVNGAIPDIGLIVKNAMGGAPDDDTWMYPGFVTVSCPAALPTVSETV